MTAPPPLLFGRYQLLELIARGGMAEVFKARSRGVEGFEKTVVIKRILPELAQNQHFVEMFLQEARLSVSLSHANIVQVFDLGRDEDTYFIAMEYVSGLDLAQAIRASRRAGTLMPVELCVHIAGEIARALDYAHRRKDATGRPLGLVHRDISPPNVLISFEGEVKVADFGIARARSSVEVAGAVKGKYAYMSPEQADGRDVDARADLYALGVTLREMLTGHNPFTAATPDEVRRRARMGECTPLAKARANLPQELIALVERLMAGDASARPASAARTYEELAEVLRGLGQRVRSHDIASWIQGVRTLIGDRDMRVSASDIEAVPEESTPTVQPHSEQRDASVVSVVLNADPAVAAEALAPFDRILCRHGGVIVERTETSLAAAFGVAHPDGRDPVTATRMALRMQAATLRAAQAREPIATAGAGVHVTRLTVRGDNTIEPDALLAEALDVVNALAHAARNRVLASDFVAAAGADQFDCVSVAEGAVVVRGVLSPSRRRVAGRRELFKVFGELLARAANDGALAINLTGAAGIGKTRFVEEVVYRLRKMGHPVTWFGASCVPYDREVPQSALQLMLRSILGIDEGDSEATIREKARALRNYGLNPEEMLAVGTLLGMVGVGGEVRPATARALRGAIFKVVRSAVQGQVTVLAWDSAEHMDEPSRACLTDLLVDAAAVPVMVLVSGRPGRAWHWEPSTPHETIALDPLNIEEVQTLVALRLGSVAPPTSLVDNLWRYSQGNPFYVEEYLKYYQHLGAVTVEGEVAHFMEPERIEIPRTIRGLVASRVTYASAPERRLLQVASVLGVEFDEGTLAKAAQIPCETCVALLDAMSSASLVQRVARDLWRFASADLRTVLFDAINPEVRQAIGRAIAATQPTGLR